MTERPTRRPTGRRRWVGRWVMGVGAWHVAFGIWWFGAALGRAARDAMWNAIGWTRDDAALGFWFLMAGGFALLAGVLADHVERYDGELPASFGWGIAALALVGAAAVPLSGFWLLFVPAAVVLDARRRSPTSAARATPGPRATPR